jgi:acyl-coenzyme A thioesterase PaaI-like protein
MTPQSIQEQLYPGLNCFGCGPGNASGLRLRSFAVDGRIEAHFRPRPDHDNGAGYLNGGIAATLIDCHSGAAVYLTAHERGWLPVGDISTPYVTAGLDVRYRRPVPLGSQIELVATVGEASPAEITVEVELSCDGKVRVSGTASWKRPRSR